MANVWIARPRDGHGAERLVVLKTILPRYATEPRFQEMFLREGGIAARISHRNVARIFDLGETQGVLYIAMEYVDGEALSRLVRAAQKEGLVIPPNLALRVIADVCAGLHHAHELRDGTGRLLNVVHCDVSPPNILLNSQGVVKLIDFGIAETHLRADDQDTGQGVLKGKAHYMAPEQAYGRPVDRRADIFAVGAIMYSLLAGRHAYEGKDDTETLLLVTSGQPPRPLPAHVPLAFGSISLKALSHRPEDRYATAAQMQQAIEGAVREAGLWATPADIAAFAAPLLKERAEARQATIDAALAAALERERPAARGQSAPDSTNRYAALHSRRVRLAALAVLALGLAVGVRVLLTIVGSQ